MPRAIWKGSIVFGLVEIPVEMISAEKTQEKLKFSYIDRRDFSPVGYERVSKKSGKVVPWEQIVRGYEYEEGEYVVLTEQDFKRANPKVSRSIEILSFVGKEEIDPFFYETPYYLEPVRKDSKGYALLRETLRKTNKVGVARFVFHTREHLAALDVRGSALSLDTLRYAHQLKEPDVVDAPAAKPGKSKVTPREVAMASQIVEGMTTRWNPKEYKDDYHTDLLSLIKKKVKAGQTKTIEETESEEDKPRRSAEVIDLMPLLKKSVEKTRGARKGPKARRARGA